MPSVGNLSSWIRVEGKALPEHRVEYSPDGQEVTCWIPSEAGKKFYVCYKDSSRELTTGTKVFVDGQPCGSQISYSRHVKSLVGEPSTLILKGAMTSGDMRRPFLFSDCQLVDDDNLLDRSSLIGQIKVYVNEIEVREYMPGGQSFSFSPLIVHERAKKGIVHGVTLGEGVSKVKKVRNATVLRRLAVFTFNYRPLAYLMAEGIVPSSQPAVSKRRAPKPPPELIDLTTEEVAVKTEVKQERIGKAVVDKTVIDLTD